MTCFETGWAVLLNINIWKDWASIITPLIAIIGVIYAARQIYTSKLEARRATAYAVYNDYLKMCMENTDYACGVLEGENKGLHTESEYKWFVARMLFSFEQIIDTCKSKSDDGWRITIERQLKRHKSHLKIPGSVSRNEWSKELSKIIKAVQLSDV